MLDKPLHEVLENGFDVEKRFFIAAFQFFNPHDEVVVALEMVWFAGIRNVSKECFFFLEMKYGIFSELQQSSRNEIGTIYVKPHGSKQFVDEVTKTLMLLVDFCNSKSEASIPVNEFGLLYRYRFVGNRRFLF